MPLRRIPDPDAIEAEIGEKLALLRYGAERCAPQAAMTLQNSGLRFDPTGHATVFRLHFREFIEGAGLDYSDLENCGILIRIPGYEIRVLKAGPDGKAPIPGDSRALLRFFNQRAHWREWQPRLPGFAKFFPEERDGVAPLHLIVYWHATRTGDLIEAKWACPKSAVAHRAEWYFNQVLPNPVLHVAAPETQDIAATGPVTDDNIGFTLRDLPHTAGDWPEDDLEG